MKATDTIRLVAPAKQGGKSLAEALDTRRSVREFTRRPLTKDQLSQLLWAVQGVTSDEGLRTAPSAGALYPLEIYTVSSHGVYQYDPARHELRKTMSADQRKRLHRAALSQEPILAAPHVFVITAVYGRTARKYGQARARRYAQMEVGHAAQNLLLQAVALDLAAVPIGAFDDEEVSNILQLPANEAPLYLIPVGHGR
jgi:SagB-type dehydrogenase family enzyme